MLSRMQPQIAASTVNGRHPKNLVSTTYVSKLLRSNLLLPVYCTKLCVRSCQHLAVRPWSLQKICIVSHIARAAPPQPYPTAALFTLYFTDQGVRTALHPQHRRGSTRACSRAYRRIGPDRTGRVTTVRVTASGRCQEAADPGSAAMQSSNWRRLLRLARRPVPGTPPPPLEPQGLHPSGLCGLKAA